MNDSTTPTPVDVAVIGGGLAGLTAAATAARAGATVALLESRGFGGRARSTDRDGYVLNEGGHALYRAKGGWDVLTSLGVHPDGVAPPLADYRVDWHGDIVKLPVATTAMLATGILSTRSKMKIGRWFGDLAATTAATGERSLDAWLDDEGARSDLRDYVRTMGRLTTYSADPGAMPARAVLGQFAPGGVAYLHGGWQSIVDQLVAVCRTAGVALHDHAVVTSVDDDDGMWSVGIADGVGVRARSVVLAAAGPQLATQLLGRDPAGWVERSGPPVRAACLDIGGVDGDCGLLLSVEEPLYASRHAPVARLAPEGRPLYSLMRYLAADDADTADDNRAALEAHAVRAGIRPDAPRDVERFLAAPVVAWGTPRPGVSRPTGAELAHDGVWAAGDWVGDRLLADASLVSGSAAGAAAARRAMVAA